MARTCSFAHAATSLATAALLTLAPGPMAAANTISGVAATGTPDACYSDEIQTIIQDCIQKNHDNPPPGNPGPFTRGYNTMVVLTGQCYGGGLSVLTGIGDNVVVGAAADPDSQSNWYQSSANDTSTANYLWMAKLIDELKSNPNRTIKDILDAVKAANPDPHAGTPDPATSTGGGTVTLGDPAGGGAKSYHAVLFGGVLEDTAANAASANAAARKALNDMQDVLENQLHVPAANIDKKFPGTCDDLKNMIQAAWQHMNDNEQFILVLANHGAKCLVDKSPVDPDPDTGGQKASFDTPHYMTDPNVHDPSVLINTELVSAPGQVLLNGQEIGSLFPSTGPEQHEFPIPPGLLSPVGLPNLVQVLIAPPDASILTVGATTGPVTSGAVAPPVPVGGRLALALMMLAVLGGGAVALRRRTRPAEG